MSRTVQRIASRTLLSITFIFALTQVHVFAQAYTWRNVQIFGGGFIVGIVFNQPEPNLVYTRTDIGGGRPGAEVNPKLGWMTETLEIDPFNSNRFMYSTGASTSAPTAAALFMATGSNPAVTLKGGKDAKKI